MPNKPDKIYELIKFGWHPKKEVYCDNANLQVDYNVFKQGEKIEEPWSAKNSLEFSPENAGPACDVLCWRAFTPVVSLRIKSLLENEIGVNRDSENVQFLPVQIHEKGNPANSMGTYYIMNVLRVLEGAADLEKSKKGYAAYLELAFFRSKIEGAAIFKAPESRLSLYVSSRVRRLMRSKKYGLNLTGVRFTEVQVTEDV